MLTTTKVQIKLFKPSEHPYRKYESAIWSKLGDQVSILDAGCGRTASILKKFKGKERRLIGVDLEKPLGDMDDIIYIKGDIANIDLPDCTIDMVISRAVLEHIKQPNDVFKEISRILKTGGYFITLVPNLTDYVSIISKITPNKLHKIIVSKTEGRDVGDIFPTFYKANTYGTIKRLGMENKLKIENFIYLGQYPAVFMFNTYLFLFASIYEKIINKFRFLSFLRGWILVTFRKV